jgi:serine protease Do
MNNFMAIGISILLFAIPGWSQTTGWLGIQIEDHADRGAIVRSVEPNSPAAKAGLKEGDIVIEFNRQEIIGVQQLTRIVRETPVGRTVEVKVRRENRDQAFQVTMEAAPGFNFPGWTDRSGFSDRILRIPRIDSAPRIDVNPGFQIYVDGFSSQHGLRVEQLTDQLRDFFGVFTNAGVLVSSVGQGSAAEKAGLKAGDVITSVDGRTVRTPSEFNREMRAGSSKIALKVVREKKEIDISISL